MTNDYPQNPVIIVDDEKYILDSIRGVLLSGGIGNIRVCDDSLQAMPLIRSHSPSLVLLDLTMPNLSGEELLEMLHREMPELPVIIITGVNELSTAVNCMKKGASDYLVKAIENSKLLSAVRSVLNLHDLRQENRLLKATLLEETELNPDSFREIITGDRKMHSIFRYLAAVAPSPHTILLRGDTGTGKELLARAVHSLSGRTGEFVGINAAGLDDTMFSDTLFGHKRGAFSGADSSRPGLVEKAAGGTLFLDEIGDLPSSSQIKLLRLLEQGEYYPLGSDMLKKGSCRIIAATHQDLGILIEEGRFRKDLYYRLTGHEIRIPRLMERPGDIPLLVRHFLKAAAAELGIQVPEIRSDFLENLQVRDFPGNIRELQAVIRQALGRSGGAPLSAFHLQTEGSFHPGQDSGRSEGKLPPAREPDPDYPPESLFPRELPTLKACGEALVREALKRTGGNISRAAALLGISQPALSKRLGKTSRTEEFPG